MSIERFEQPKKNIGNTKRSLRRMDKQEIYSTNAGRMIPADAECYQCNGDGHIWDGDIPSDCWLCDGLGYFADMLPDENEDDWPDEECA